MSKELEFKESSLSGLDQKKLKQGELGTAKSAKHGKGDDFGVNLDLMKNLSDVKINQFDAGKKGSGGEVQPSLWREADKKEQFYTSKK
jgi:hypothetical protein